MVDRRRFLRMASGFVLAGDAAAQAPVVDPPASADTAGLAPLQVVRFSTLEDSRLHDADGANAGEFEDVVLDLQSGRILHAVVSIDRGFGRGEEERAVPLRELGVFGRSPADSKPVRIVLRPPARSLPAARKPEAGSPYASGEGLLDDDIEDASGRELGEVKDLLVDLRSGQVRSALVELERGVGPRDRLFVVALARLRRKEGRSDRLVHDESVEALAASPAVAKDRLDVTDFVALQ